MKQVGTKRPKITWGQFLDAAPWFAEAMYGEDDCLGAEWAPLVRAVAYFNIFQGQVQNGGVSQYLFNHAADLPHFSEAPEIVRQHPLLKEVADLMTMVHGDKDMIRHYVDSHREQNESMLTYLETGEGGDTPITYEEKYRTSTEAFDERAWKANEAAQMRVHRHLLEQPERYFDFAPIPGVTSKGVETVETMGYNRVWELRLVDGFPIGPNLQRDEFGGIRILRFSADRLHLDFDHARFSADSEPGREWVDYFTGLGSTRTFKKQRLESVAAKLNFWEEHGLREYYDDQGRSQSVSMCLKDVRVEMYHPLREGSPFKVSTPWHGGNVVRKYFSNGQLNIEQVYGKSFPFRTTACHDENGADLAPNGTGEYRELWSMEEGGPRWRVGRLVDGLLDGEVRYINPDGSEWSKEHWDRGLIKEER